MAIAVEPNDSFVNTHPAMSWRATVAGLLISFFVFAILLSLGVAMGGVSLADGANLRSSGIIGAIWLLVSVLLSLFAGSYIAARISNFAAPWVGMAQGFVLASLFMGILGWQLIGLAGWLTSATGNLLGSAARAGAQAAPAAQNLASSMNMGVNEIIEDNLGDVQFRGEPTTVMTGVASRLVRGNNDAAKAYLARNSNLTVAEVDQRINDLQAQLTQAADEARVAAAKTLQYLGWSLFATMVLGLITSVAAGVMGSLANRTSPAARATLPGFRPEPVGT
jgi:hypothetical protein